VLLDSRCTLVSYYRWPTNATSIGSDLNIPLLLRIIDVDQKVEY
jgi:hypothetical protein